jgi:hypothetical protein
VRIFLSFAPKRLGIDLGAIYPLLFSIENKINKNWLLIGSQLKVESNP